MNELVRMQDNLIKINQEIKVLKRRLNNVSAVLSNKKVVKGIGEKRAIETVSKVVNELNHAIKSIENIRKIDFENGDTNDTNSGRLSRNL